MVQLEVTIGKDTASPGLAALHRLLGKDSVARVVGTACTRLVQDHLNGLGPNKQGWPSTGFYAAAARGTSWDKTDDGVEIHVENENAPGAMNQRFHGGTINAKDKLLTIPARAEAYGHRATEFTNLRLAVFASGSMALVVGSGGIRQVNFRTGRERSVVGAGARSESIVMFWLKSSVDQDPDPGVLPTSEQLGQAATGAVLEMLRGGRL